MAQITSEQECLLNEIEDAVAAFRRDGKLLFRPRTPSGSDWEIIRKPHFNFNKCEYKPVPKPEFKWPEGLNVASIRINEERWLEFCFHGSPNKVMPLNTLRGDIIESMEVGKWYHNPLGQEQPVKS